MAMKSNFEETSDINSPFVDEVANPGNGLSAARQALKDIKEEGQVQEFLRQSRKPKVKKTKPKKDKPATGFQQTPGLRGRKAFIEGIN